MAFQKFTQVNSRFETRITITPTSAFGFPAQFYKEQGLAEYKYAILYFDPDTLSIGFHFTNDENEPHKFSILKSKQGYGGQITARSFFRSYNLDPKIYRGKYDWKPDESDSSIGKLYIIKLKEKKVIETIQQENVASEPQEVGGVTIEPQPPQVDQPPQIPSQPQTAPLEEQQQPVDPTAPLPEESLPTNSG